MTIPRHSREGGNPVTDHLDLWSSVYVKKATTGRGSNGNKVSPYGIQKLRELILELAVRGKLVAQDSNDEPASELLKKMSMEEAKLVNGGLIKKPKNFPEIQDDEKSLELPETWAWVRIRKIGHDWGQKKPDQDFSYIDVSAIDNHSGKVTAPTILSPAEAPSRARKIVKKGTVIYSTVRPYLKSIAVVEDEMDPEPIASTAFAILHPYAGIPAEYLVTFFRSPVFVRYVESVQAGIAYPAINDKQFFGAVFPLPPLAEQHRIVAKVDELMALCDQLEQQQTDSLQIHQTLVETLLRTLVEAGDAESTQQAWNRIAEHFDTLFTTEASIDQLKQTILQLAVMGRLVMQDINDEPVVVPKGALEIPGGKNKKKLKWSGPIEEKEKPFRLPSTWAWFRLGDVSVLKHGYAFSSEFFTSEPAPFVLTTPGNFYEKGGFRDRESKRKYYNGPVNPEFIFTPGDLIIPMTEQAAGLLGSPAFIPDDGRIYLHNQRLGKMSFEIKVVLPEFAFWFFNCDFFRNELARTCTGMKVRHTSPDRVLRVPFPVCPVAEQCRIITKVNELMALCDTLKANIQQTQTTQTHLADAIVEQAVA